MQVDLTFLEGMIRFRQRVNSSPLEGIEWTKDGKIISIDPFLIEEWLFTGSNNTDFARTHLLKDVEAPSL